MQPDPYNNADEPQAPQPHNEVPGVVEHQPGSAVANPQPTPNQPQPDIVASGNVMAAINDGIEPNAKAVQLRGLLIKMMLGCLIAAASVAVIAILIGSMTDIVWRAINTIISAMVHLGILFAIVSMTANGNRKMIESTNFVINSSIVIVVMSFFTSIFATWDVINLEWATKLYMTYAVILFVLLHAKTLLDVEAVYEGVKGYVRANFAVMGFVALLILGLIYAPYELNLLGGFYGRLLAAAAIVDVTISVVVAVLHRLYIQKHPEMQRTEQVKHGGSGGRIIVAILLFIFIIWPLMTSLLAFSR